MTLRASITLDGRLADPAIELQEGDAVTTIDARQAGQLLVAGHVHELRLTIRPRIDGRRDAPTLSGAPTPEFFPRSLACRLLRMETLHGECLLHYRVVRRRRAAAWPD